MNVALLVASTLVIAASALPLVRRDEWWIRAFDFPRLQILATGALVLAGIVGTAGPRTPLEVAVVVALLVALASHAHAILPYTPLYPKEVLPASTEAPEATLSLLVANVLMTNREAGRLLTIIREHAPDLVATLEPDAWWERELRVLEDAYPHTIKEPRANRYGMILYSRLPLVGSEIKHLVSDEIPSIHTRVRLSGGAGVWLHLLHPEPPSPTEAEESTERDAELLVVGRAVKDREAPTVVAGDLNDVAWSYTTRLFQKISGLLDPRKGRGMFNSFHARVPIARWPLDHIFHSAHFTLVELARLPAFGSDHFPVLGRLLLEPGATALHDEIEASPADEKLAEEKIDAVEMRDEP